MSLSKIKTFADIRVNRVNQPVIIINSLVFVVRSPRGETSACLLLWSLVFSIFKLHIAVFWIIISQHFWCLQQSFTKPTKHSSNSCSLLRIMDLQYYCRVYTNAICYSCVPCQHFGLFPDLCRQPAVDMVIDGANHCTRLRLGGLGGTWL